MDTFQTGDSVRVFPHGKPKQVAEGCILIVSKNQRSIMVAFRDKPPFVMTKRGMLIHPELGALVMMAVREEAGPWVEMMGGGHYEIEMGGVDAGTPETV